MGELWAAVHAMRHGTPPLEIVTDYQGLVDGVVAGEATCVEAKYPYAELWRELWVEHDRLQGRIWV